MVASVRHLVELVDDRSTFHSRHFISDRLLTNRLVVAISLKSVSLKCVRKQRTTTLFALYTAVSRWSFVFFYFLLSVCFIGELTNAEDTLNVKCLTSQQRNLVLEICDGGRVGSQSAWINTSDDKHTRETQRNEVFVGRVYSSNAANWLTECASRRIRSPCSYYGKDESNCFLDSYDSLVLFCTQ